MPSSAAQLEQTLRDLPRVGSLVKDRGYRQIWRFEHDGKSYYLKFYPRRGGGLKRLVRGSPALREFTRLQLLQKASIPSPRAVAMLVGYRLDAPDGMQIGDAVILEGIEPSQQLDLYLNRLQLDGLPVPDHLSLSRQLVQLLQQLARAKLGHSDLHLGNVLLDQSGKLHLLDGYAVRKDGLRLSDLLLLGHSARPFASNGDLQRAWDTLGPGGPLPTYNPQTTRLVNKFLSRVEGENRYFGEISAGEWGGYYFKHAKYPKRWSDASRLEVTEKDWASEWPRLLAQIDSGQIETLKSTRSGDVLAGEVTLAGRPVGVIVKHPRRKLWHRYLTDVVRGTRARRAWRKSWDLVARNVPTAWPLLLMERRKLGYVTDALIVFERVPGETLARSRLNELPARERNLLFRRTGRTLRQLDQHGLHHWDAKATNWMVRPDERLGPQPVLIDVDGIRRWPKRESAPQRLLRSLRDHPQYTPADSLALCQGYAPHAKMIREGR